MATRRRLVVNVALAIEAEIKVVSQLCQDIFIRKWHLSLNWVVVGRRCFSCDSCMDRKDTTSLPSLPSCYLLMIIVTEVHMGCYGNQSLMPGLCLSLKIFFMVV
ncbi:uncharacterized protein [Rutidosis leptorrhynchoides]|uniref:uncharacterized protein n=1 Tax=Rutidosis leptorrhynchoides TaxID=125765 RepID=UPI003A98D014